MSLYLLTHFFGKVLPVPGLELFNIGGSGWTQSFLQKFDRKPANRVTDLSYLALLDYSQTGVQQEDVVQNCSQATVAPLVLANETLY